MDNLQNLMEAANQKLDAQKKAAESAGPGQDIYADIKAEMNGNYGEVPQIRHDDNQYYQNEGIAHEGEPEGEFYVDADDEPVFEGGPGIGQVGIWKKQFSREKVFHTKILDKDFIFRTLNRFEYKQIVAIENIDALYREELICQTCTLWPIGYNFQMMAEDAGGYPSTLAQIIMENSGFTKEYGIEIL